MRDEEISNAKKRPCGQYFPSPPVIPLEKGEGDGGFSNLLRNPMNRNTCFTYFPAGCSPIRSPFISYTHPVPFCGKLTRAFRTLMPRLISCPFPLTLTPYSSSFLIHPHPLIACPVSLTYLRDIFFTPLPVLSLFTTPPPPPLSQSFSLYPSIPLSPSPIPLPYPPSTFPHPIVLSLNTFTFPSLTRFSIAIYHTAYKLGARDLNVKVSGLAGWRGYERGLAGWRGYERGR